jgi:hypothetical protein
MSSIALKLAVLAAAALTVVAVAGAAPTSYLDPTGDNGASADIGGVSVDLAADGYLHVKATIANMPALLTPGDVILALDTDRSGSTGLLAGGDYVVLVDMSDLSGAFLKWSGTEYAAAPAQQGDLRYLIGGGGIEFLIRPAALGGATAFNFVLGAGTGAGDGAQVDVAPDNGTWFFEVQQPAPAPAPAVATSAKATYAPTAPRAGRAFRVTGASVRLDNGASAVAASFRCRATLAGKALRGTGVGGCTFAVPRTAKGKRLVVTVSATYAGRTLSIAPRTFVVR